MTVSEWISVLALIISSGGFAIQARSWLVSGPRLHLSVMGDAISIPDDGRGNRLVLTVINRGTEPTMLTNMVVYIYPSRWRKWKRRSTLAGVVNTDSIPAKLEINGTWMGQMRYDEKTKNAHKNGHLYVGVIASHSNGSFLVRVPPPKNTDDVPTKQVAAG